MALVKPTNTTFAKIKVIGVGGGGGNAVNSMIDSNQIESDEAFKADKGSKAKQECATIQGGTILDEDGMTIQVGFNQTGYNYQAKTYSGE